MIKYLYLTLFLTTATTISAQTDTIQVTKIVDGDTFYGRSSGGEVIKYRPIGFDTPEESNFGKPAEPYNEEATAHFTTMIGGKTVLVKYDVQQLDKYGRHLVYVYLLDGTFVNVEMLRAGWATVMTYPPNVRHVKEFRAAYKEGRESGRGMWR